MFSMDHKNCMDLLTVITVLKTSFHHLTCIKFFLFFRELGFLPSSNALRTKRAAPILGAMIIDPSQRKDDISNCVDLSEQKRGRWKMSSVLYVERIVFVIFSCGECG